MRDRPAEVTQLHTRILRCALAVEDARAYWGVPDLGPVSGRAAAAFKAYWFGARSLARVEVLLTNMRVRFDQYPEALAVLRAWPDMDPAARVVICHWHLQLADPLYRAFTGEFLVRRRAEGRPDVTLPQAVAWVGEQDSGKWTMSTRLQFAGKLLSAAAEAGLVGSNRDPRPLRLPKVPDDALVYVLYLLRGVDISGTVFDNPYLASVGLTSEDMPSRLRTLPGLHYARQAGVVEVHWDHDSLASWFAKVHPA
jgi:hypothetical protein